MRSSPGRTGRETLWRRIRPRGWRGWSKWIALLSWLVAVLCCAMGCGTVDRHHIARATRLPEETRGFLRVIQEDAILVGIVGEDVAERRSIAGYLVLHEQDVAEFVRAVEEIARLSAVASRPAPRASR